MNIRFKHISSLEKVFLDSDFDSFKQIDSITSFKGERISYQIVIAAVPEHPELRCFLNVHVKSPLSNAVTLRSVGSVPSELPAYREHMDEDYLSDKPGLFPDVLSPIQKDGQLLVKRASAVALWVTIEVPAHIKADEYPVTICFCDPEKDFCHEMTLKIKVKNEILPAHNMRTTQWFHADCIATHYGLEPLSEAHWERIEQFIKLYVHTGMNTILTPIFTPPLDTVIGGERPTVQLVDIEKSGTHYIFSFEKLERWVALCLRHNIKYFEMAHLVTQWGASFTPKIIVRENGEDKKMFGWHITSRSDEYRDFLHSFLPALVSKLHELGIASNTYFHISDEPSSKRDSDYENYQFAKNLVAPYLKEFTIIDALSNIKYFDDGLVTCPIPATDHIGPFLQRQISERWCYYCCSQGFKVANRFFAMPSRRNRISGIQFYLFGINGFLHWGYNFYYSRLSQRLINPYAVTDADCAFPSGDAFSVYPDQNGPVESLRAVVFYEGLQDMAALTLLEQKIGREAVVALIKQVAGMEITFDNYPKTDNFFTELRERIHDILNQKH